MRPFVVVPLAIQQICHHSAQTREQRADVRLPFCQRGDAVCIPHLDHMRVLIATSGARTVLCAEPLGVRSNRLFYKIRL